MFGRFNLDTGDLALAFGIWLCSLPLIALLAIPLFGFKVGGLTAIAILVALMVFVGAFFGNGPRPITLKKSQDKETYLFSS